MTWHNSRQNAKKPMGCKTDMIEIEVVVIYMVKNECIIDPPPPLPLFFWGGGGSRSQGAYWFPPPPPPDDHDFDLASVLFSLHSRTWHYDCYTVLMLLI